MIGEDDGGRVFPVTRAERRRLNRKRLRQKRLRIVNTFGFLTGLSITSFLASHLARGTQALLTDHATETQTIRTLSFFPDTLSHQAASVQGYANQAAVCATTAKDLAAQANNCKTSAEATNLLNQANDLYQEASGLENKASDAYQTLTQWIHQDQQDLSTQGADVPLLANSPVSGSPAVPDWVTSAQTTGNQALTRATDAVGAIQVSIKSLADRVSSLKAQEETNAVTQQTSVVNQPSGNSSSPSGNSNNSTSQTDGSSTGNAGSESGTATGTSTQTAGGTEGVTGADSSGVPPTPVNNTTTQNNASSSPSTSGE